MGTRLRWAVRRRASSKCLSWFEVADMLPIHTTAGSTSHNCLEAAEPEAKSERTTQVEQESVCVPPADDELGAPSVIDEPPAVTAGLEPAESLDAVGSPPPLLPVVEV